MTDKETTPPPVDWENCKGQCGYTPYCRQCLAERKRLIQEKKLAERQRREQLDDAKGK